jgi:hypothetical protein
VILTPTGPIPPNNNTLSPCSKAAPNKERGATFREEAFTDGASSSIGVASGLAVDVVVSVMVESRVKIKLPFLRHRISGNLEASKN